MILNKEVFNELSSHPKPPKEGYISLYSYGGTLYLMRPNGLYYDLMGGTGGVVSLKLEADTSTFSGLSINFTAGASLVKGDVCYLSSGKMYKGDADAVASTFVIGIATDTIAENAEGEFLLLGIIGGFTSLTIGAPVFLSSTPGTITQTIVSGSNKVVQILGMAISETHIYFKPELAQVELL